MAIPTVQQVLGGTAPKAGTTPATTQGLSSTTTNYQGPGVQSAQASATFPRLLSDLDNLLNAHGTLGVLNVVSDVEVFLARGAVVGIGVVFGIAGLVLVIGSIWGKAPAGLQSAAETTGAAGLAAAAA